MEASMADWSQLPRELVVLIASRIEHLSDYIRFCAVCKWWLSITAQENPRPRLRESPWLMLPAKNNSYSHQLYSPLMEDRFHPIKQEEKEETCALGSSPDGWVCMVDQKYNIYLFNPFSGSRFALPPFFVKKYSNNVSNQGLRGLPCEHLIKVVWTPDPTNSGPKSVVISTTKRLAVWRHSKQERYWTTFWSEYAPFNDMVYHEEEDMFFMMSHLGCLMTFNLYSLIKVAYHLPRPPRDISKMLIVSKELRYYLAIRGGPSSSSSSSSLVLVVREIEKRKTKGFKVFELNRRRMRWELKESLEDDGMLFLGLNSSTYHFMTGGGGSKCKGNRIYFTDDSIGRSSYDDNLINLGRHDMGVFSLDDGSFEWNHCRKWKGPHPIWIFPNWQLPSIDFEI